MWATCNQWILERKTLLLIDVLFASEIVHNLISIRKLTECKHEVCFKGTDIFVINDNDIVFNSFVNGISMSKVNLCVQLFY